MMDHDQAERLIDVLDGIKDELERIADVLVEVTHVHGPMPGVDGFSERTLVISGSVDAT